LLLESLLASDAGTAVRSPTTRISRFQSTLIARGSS
jgi:hypothetical protein